MISKIHHVAIVVKSLENDLNIYSSILGLNYEVKTLKEYAVQIAFIDIKGVLVELIQPTSENDPLGFYDFLKNAGGGLHHIAYEVNDINSTIKKLKSYGISLIDEEPKTGADGKIVFAHKESMGGVLVEFVETEKLKSK